MSIKRYNLTCADQDPWKDEAPDGGWCEYRDLPHWRTVKEGGMPQEACLWEYRYSTTQGGGITEMFVKQTRPKNVRPQDRYIPLRELQRLPGGEDD